MIFLYIILLSYSLPSILVWLTFRYRIRKGYDKAESILIFCTLCPLINIIMLVVANSMTLVESTPKLTKLEITNKFFNIK